MKNESYEELVNDLVEHILETTGTGGVALTSGSSLGTMRHRELSPPGKDLSFDPEADAAKITLTPALYPKLVPTKQVVSKENFKYDKARGERLVQDQYAKTAEWLRAIMQGQANAQKQELLMQKKALELTTAENDQKLAFEKQKLGLDAKRLALKAKYAPSNPKITSAKKK